MEIRCGGQRLPRRARPVELTRRTCASRRSRKHWTIYYPAELPSRLPGPDGTPGRSSDSAPCPHQAHNKHDCALTRSTQQHSATAKVVSYEFFSLSFMLLTHMAAQVVTEFLTRSMAATISSSEAPRQRDSHRYVALQSTGDHRCHKALRLHAAHHRCLRDRFGGSFIGLPPRRLVHHRRRQHGNPVTDRRSPSQRVWI